MQIGQRLRELRKAKNFTQGDIQKRAGLLRSYTSRVEHGQTVPSITTLEKYARALEVPLYRLFYEGEEPPQKPILPPAEEMEPMGDASGGGRGWVCSPVQVHSLGEMWEERVPLPVCRPGSPCKVARASTDR